MATDVTPKSVPNEFVDLAGVVVEDRPNAAQDYRVVAIDVAAASEQYGKLSAESAMRHDVIAELEGQLADAREYAREAHRRAQVAADVLLTSAKDAARR